MHRAAVALSTLALASAGVVLAAPAHATETVVVACSGGSFVVMPTSLTVTQGDTFSVVVSATLTEVGVTITGDITGPTVVQPLAANAGVYTVTGLTGSISIRPPMGECGDPAPATVSITVTPSPEPAPDPAAATAPTFTLSVNSGGAAGCSPSVSGVGGTWVQLTDEGCTPPRPGASLLGWSTSDAFPVARATSGVAVDEIIDGIRMIFIPLNGYTFMSGDNSIYPIWSN